MSDNNPWQPVPSAQEQPSTKRVEDFLASAKPSAEARRKARILFALDATASRQPSWDSAMQVQASMFLETSKLGSLEISLCYFRGHDECKASKWVSAPRQLLDFMTSIQCRAGNTQLRKVLKRALDEDDKQHISALIYIGDAFEENFDIDSIIGTASQFKARDIPIFMFQEGISPNVKDVFDQIAAASSGGCRVEFNSNSPEALRALLAAIATLAVGGRAALEDLAAKGSLEAKQILQLTGPSAQSGDNNV